MNNINNCSINFEKTSFSLLVHSGILLFNDLTAKVKALAADLFSSLKETYANTIHPPLLPKERIAKKLGVFDSVFQGAAFNIEWELTRKLGTINFQEIICEKSLEGVSTLTLIQSGERLGEMKLWDYNDVLDDQEQFFLDTADKMREKGGFLILDRNPWTHVIVSNGFQFFLLTPDQLNEKLQGGMFKLIGTVHLDHPNN